MSHIVKTHKRLKGVYWISSEEGISKLATLNLSPGKKVYGERLIRINDQEFRIWDPYKSKLAATILRNVPNIPIHPGNRVLYLGAASGTTVSHISDIIGESGCIYCVESSPRPLRELLSNVCAFRKRVFPIFADARLPERYRVLLEKVDMIYCDVAQPEQAKILSDNAKIHLKDGGSAMLAIKARSISSTRKLPEIFKEEVEKLKSNNFYLNNVVSLRPYDKAHAMVVSEYKGGS